MKYLVVLMLAYWMFPLMGTGQVSTEDNSGFNIYIFTAYYTKNVSDYLLQHNFSEAHLLTAAVIDPDKDQNINAEAVRKYTIGFYPETNATGLFIIDWEAREFNDLRKYDKGDERFKAAEEKFIELINIIKTCRPRVKVSIYGIPFRFFNESQRKANGTTKLDNLLSHCDVITPSFYMVYTDEQVGEQRNLDYLKQNMELALAFGARLKKDVVPFFWYRIHPGNKRFGMTVLSKDQMQKYLRLLTSYQFQRNKLNGVIWWEGGSITKKRPGDDRQARAFSATANAAGSNGSVDRDSLIIDYTAPFLKKKKQ